MADRDYEEAWRKRDEAHRAIGHYVVEFSMLVQAMREGIALALCGHPPSIDPVIVRLALGEAYAAQLANAYFAICEESADLDDEEKQVASRLKNEVLSTIKDRNDFAHGDWNLGGIPDVKEPSFQRIKPGRRAGAMVEVEKSVEEIDEMAESIVYLDAEVVEFGWLCLGHHPLSQWKDPRIRVRDIFRFQSRKGVLREGRYADLHWANPAAIED